MTRREAGSEATALRLWLLGGFRVEAGASAIPDAAWRLRKAKSLVKVLALAPDHAMHHEQVMDLLWPDLASAHYSNVVKELLNERNVPFVPRQDNPPNVPQARPIETVWALLEQKVYENNWEAENLDALARRIKQKAKEGEGESGDTQWASLLMNLKLES